jgi:hypothetical protein
VAVSAGGVAAVRVTVATLWSSPGAVRPADEAALGPNPDIAAWVAGMSPEERLDSGVLSQLPLGEQVLVDEVRPDRWARVVALDQPATGRDARGYPGWLPVDQVSGAVTAEPNGHGAWLVVDAPVTDLLAKPAGAVALPGVVMGTRLRRTGPADGDWCPVAVPGHHRPLWAHVDDVGGLPAEQACVVPAAMAAGARPVPADTAAPPVPAQVPRTAGEALGLAALSVARRLTGVPYVWGGLSVHGIDCSGLVRLAWRRLGVTLPRDSPDQAAVTTDVPLGEERPGDLYFFARPGRPIHHVGIVTGEGRMLHASYETRQVVEEPLPDTRAATLVAARRVPSAVDVD